MRRSQWLPGRRCLLMKRQCERPGGRFLSSSTFPCQNSRSLCDCSPLFCYHRRMNPCLRTKILIAVGCVAILVLVFVKVASGGSETLTFTVVDAITGAPLTET